VLGETDDSRLVNEQGSGELWGLSWRQWSGSVRATRRCGRATHKVVNRGSLIQLLAGGGRLLDQELPINCLENMTISWDEARSLVHEGIEFWQDCGHAVE
jgi:hypothetical protein